jgi:hypothetical protein
MSELNINKFKSQLDELTSSIDELRSDVKKIINHLLRSIPNYSKYNDIFGKPNYNITYIFFDSNKIKAINLDKLHDFLIDINYEPYMLFETKKPSKIMAYCSDLYKYTSIYLTYQSYINNLRYTMYDEFNLDLRLDRYDDKPCVVVRFTSDDDIYIKYEILDPSSDKQESLGGYDELMTSIYIKKIVRDKIDL